MTEFVSSSFFLLFCEINFRSIALCRLFLRSIFAYDRHSSRVNLSDVDECLERNICPGGGCQNTVGSYICIREKSAKDAPYEACPPGYEWQPLTGVCAGNKKRVLHKVFHASPRSTNYKLLLCIYFSDIDECAVLLAACPADKPFCVNTQGSYACLEMTGVKSCPAGFKFDKSLQLCKGNIGTRTIVRFVYQINS